ncbi:MAG: carboxypeptidase-like regulatory domain-containing protein [Thermofilum sp.]|jgi:hypothetical protein|uniref:carboxypeptidase-like regulatory domain-containing protein n=1 Tax=Thermofilum sp. TaxID=1961369 RepID=UPI002586D845|nr:carboxypeptidase-like regulatory domain-containing protein [Thermofilum sp.]MCI4408895.1 carboxypeptidase-like regulatory domain-containing protein [Thermofilum sp.]
MIKKKLLVIVLIAFLLSSILSPALTPLIMATSLEYATSIKTKTTFQGPYPGAYPGARTGTNNNIYGFHVIFKQCWAKSYAPGNTQANYSGSSVAFSSDGKLAYIAAANGVHIVDTQNGKEVATATIPGSYFCSNSPRGQYISKLSPRQLAPGPNGSMVAAPHFSNPYIVTPDGRKIEIPVYDEATAKNLYSYQITNDGNYYAWGNSNGVAAFTVNNDYSSQVKWKKDLSSEGGARQVSAYGTTVAAVTGNNNLYLLNKNDGSTIKTLNNVLAVTPARHSHYAAVKINDTMSGLVLVNDDGSVVPIANITGLVKAMNSGVTKGYSVVFMVTGSGLYIYVLNYTALKVIKSAFKEVNANDVTVSESSNVIYFATVGKQTLVGRVNGTDIYFDGIKNNDQPSLSGAVKGDPQINPFNNTSTNNNTVLSLPPGSVLLGEVYEAGACAQISLLVPAPAVSGPHMEVRGQFIQDVDLATGNTTKIFLANGIPTDIMPLNIKITTKKVIITRSANDLIDPNSVPQPEYHDMVVSGAFGWQVARSSSFWNSKLEDGKLIATFNYSATFFKQNLATGAFPAPSVAIWYYNVIPTQVGQYDGLDVQAQVSSTQAGVNVPNFVAGETTLVYGVEGFAYFIIPIAISMTWAAEAGGSGETPVEQLASHIKEESARKAMLAKLEEEGKMIDQVKQLMELEKKADTFAVQKLWLDAELNSGIISEQEYDAAIQEILNAAQQEGVSLDMLEKSLLKATSYLEQGMKWEGLVNILTGMSWAGSKQINTFYLKAEEAGIPPSDADQILQRAIKDATNANLQAALNTVPPEMVYLAFITGLSNNLDTLNELAQAGTLYVNISGSKVYLRPDDISVFTQAVAESVQKYANISAIIYSSVTGQAVYPQASINTLRDMYYWAKQAVLSVGGSEDDAKRVAGLLTTLTINAALYDGYQALDEHLKEKGYSNADTIALQLTRWILDMSNYAGSMYVYHDKIDSAFPPPPELIAQYFEYYAKQKYNSTTQSVKAEAIKELANIIRNSKVVVFHDREEFEKYITMGGLTGSQIVWNIQQVTAKTSGLIDPKIIAAERFGTYSLITAFLIGIAKFAPKVLGETTLGLSVSAAAELGVLALGAYFGTNVLLSVLMTPTWDRMGATTLRGFIFDVSKSNKRIGVFVLEPPPSAVIGTYPQQITHQDWFKTQLTNGAREFGYDEIIVVYSNPESFDAKSILTNAVGTDAIIKRVGIVVIPYIWMQPDVISGEDKKATMNGYVQISYMKVIGTISTYEEKETNAGLTPDQWKQIKISVYGPGSAHLGDYVPFYATDKIDNSTYQSAVYAPGGCYRNVYYIEISMPQSLSQISASLSVIIDGIIIEPFSDTTHPYSTGVYYKGTAEFRPVALGIFNLDQIPGYPKGTKPQIIEVMVNQPYSVTKQIEGQDIWKAAVNGSIYNYLFTESSTLTRIMPYGGKEFSAQYWIYLNATRPENKPTPPDPNPNPKPNPDPHKPDNNTYVTPPTNQTVMPPWINVSKGYVGLAMYLNGTNSYAMLPRLLTAYVYTQESNVSVRLTTWWSIEFENHTAKVWQPYRYGTLYNITITTPGGKYWRAINVYIANYSEFAAALAKQLNTLVVLRFWGVAVRLDNGRNMSAMSPPVMVYPDLQGKMTKATPSVSVYVYDAWSLAPISGASISFVGSNTISGSTDSKGYFSTQMNNGSYTLIVSKTGYKNFTQQLYIARDMVFNVPLVPNNADNKSLSWLTILVRTLDGMPLQGASVYINGTFVGKTDADGMWHGLFKWGDTQTVRVNYTTWSETRNVPILGPKVLTTFTASVNSQIFTPMVWAYMVYAVPVAYSNHTIMIEGGVVTNSNNTYRVEVGIKDMNGTVIAKQIYNATVDKPGTHVFGVDLQAPPIRGKYKPYLNITWAKADNDYRDNYIEGAPFKVVDYMSLVIHVIVSVDKWGKDSPGLIYPGDTVYNVTIRAWFVDSSVNDMKYSDWLAKRGGQKLNLHRPLNITVRKLAGTLDLVGIDSKTLNITSLTFGDNILYSEKVTAPFARYLVITLSVPGLGNDSVIEEDEGDIAVTWNGYKIQLPPHLIVKGVDLNSIPVVRPGDNVSVTLRVWTNYLPGEGTHGMIMLGFDMAGNGTLKGFTVAPAPELTNGEQKVSGTLVLPKDYNYNFSWWQPSKTYDAIFTVTGTPDVWSGDNYVKTKITILNTDSFVTWLLIGMGVIIVLIIILAFINAIRGRNLSRIAMSEWLERVPEKTIPSRSVHRHKENNIFNLEWFEKINKDEEK